jgi:hypothetical protein
MVPPGPLKLEDFNSFVDRSRPAPRLVLLALNIGVRLREPIQLVTVHTAASR